MSTSPERATRPKFLENSLLVVAGLLAGVVFKRLWSRITHGEHERAPSALQSEYGTPEILVAAALQGAIAGGVKALIDRGGAKAFQRWTGEWPGD